ncbi:MAG: biotin/lipoyl-binding protein, partial [Hyphomicrobiales bacterium]
MSMSVPDKSAIDPREASVRSSLRKKLIAGYAVTALFLFGLLGYSAVAEIRGAVIAPGNLVVEGNIRRIQHQDGGSVSEIRVHNGQQVKAGDLLVRLNDTQPRAELGVVLVQLYGQQVRAARLAAERDDLKEVTFPSPFALQGFDTDSASMVAVENALFVARRRARDGEIAQLKEKAEQTEQEIEGLNAQLRAVQAQSAVVRDELLGLEKLLTQGLTQLSRINPQRLNLAQLEGQAGDIKAQIARARGRISEIGVQIAQIGRQMLNEVSRDAR